MEDKIDTKNTVALLHEVYYGNTPQKKMEAANIRKLLRKELSDFKNLIREYDDADEYDKEDLIYAIHREIEDKSAFTAFKRWILWDNKERYEELIQRCGYHDTII